MTTATVDRHYKAARGLYRVKRRGSHWHLLFWRRGLNCWEQHPERLTYSEARQRRTQMVASTVLLTMGIDEQQAADLMAVYKRGTAIERIRAALKAARP